MIGCFQSLKCISLENWKLLDEIITVWLAGLRTKSIILNNKNNDSYSCGILLEQFCWSQIYLDFIPKTICIPKRHIWIFIWKMIYWIFIRRRYVWIFIGKLKTKTSSSTHCFHYVLFTWKLGFFYVWPLKRKRRRERGSTRVSGSGNQIINVTAVAAEAEADKISQVYFISDQFKVAFNIKVIERLWTYIGVIKIHWSFWFYHTRLSE